MGGHAGGDVASAIAAKRVAEADLEYATAEDAEFALQSALIAANSLLAETVFEHSELTGMGTTVSGILRVGDKIAMAHIGDSRIYRFRDGKLEQISADHTFVQRLVDSGRITAEEAAVHPRRSVLMRVLGDVDAAPEIDTAIHEVRAGDRWLLCSDGLQQLRLRRQDLDDPADRAHRAGCGRPPGQGEPRPRRPRQRHRRHHRHRRQRRHRARAPMFVGSASAPLSFESDTARRPIRLPTLLLHPLKATQPEDSHFEPEREGYLEELIEEDRRRARRRRIVWLVVVAAAIAAIVDRPVRRLPVDPVALLRRRRRRQRSRSSRACSRTSGRSCCRASTRTTTIEVADLPTFQQETVSATINADNLRDANDIVEPPRGRRGGRRADDHDRGRPGPPSTPAARSTFTGAIRVRLRAPARRRNIELVLLLFALAHQRRRDRARAARARSAGSATRCCCSARCSRCC